MDSWHSYPKIYALGHRAIRDIFEDDVIVEEKIDGSQFSCGVFDGELRCRSKGCELQIFAPEKMFLAAVARCQERVGEFRDGWTYRFEYLAKPKHNALAYERIPQNNLIGLDINTGHEAYLSYEEKQAEFARLGFETTPLVFSGRVSGPDVVRAMLARTSVLGGQLIEGVVVKNYQRFSIDGKAMLGKFVSESFKEVHSQTWKQDNPGPLDVVERITQKYTTPARWNKAIQHLREAGKLEGSPRDIGPLIHAVPDDVLSECEEEIRHLLFEYAWPKIARGLTRGLPEFYKEHLLKQSFETPATEAA